jgi:hypothetical protein
VGSVSKKGQQNFGHQQAVHYVKSRKKGQQNSVHQEAVHYVKSRDEAVKIAKAIVAPKGRIYLLDIDTTDWSEISS